MADSRPAAVERARAGAALVMALAVSACVSPQATAFQQPTAEVVEIGRVSGRGRSQTAVELAQLSHPASAETVVIARADDYADALAGGPLAAALAAPVLLSGRDALGEDTAAEVRRLAPENAVVLGGTGGLSSGVDEELRRLGVTTVERVAGTNRFATAAAIAARLGTSSAYLVQGSATDPSRGWPDAVAVAALAAAERRPILLATVDELPPATADAISGGIVDVTIVGGRLAISEKVERDVAARGARVERIAGDGRYSTSLLVADRSIARGADASRLWLTTGRNWPDALAAGPAVAADGGVLLLVDGQGLETTPATQAWLDEHHGVVQHVRVVGGRSAVTDAVVDAVFVSQALTVAQALEAAPAPTAAVAGVVAGATSRLCDSSACERVLDLRGLDLATLSGLNGQSAVLLGALDGSTLAVRRVLRGIPSGPGAWDPIPPAPLEGRSWHVEVWTGAEMIVWGGFGQQDEGNPDGTLHQRDGARYNPATQEWRGIADAPISGDPFHTAVWTGDEMLVWGASAFDRENEPVPTAAYRPATDTWRDIADDPLPPMFPSAVVWTGERMLVVGGDTSGFASATASGELTGATYDPVSDQWDEISASPLGGARVGARAQWTGTELVVWGGGPFYPSGAPGCPGPYCNDEVPPPRPTDAAAYNPGTDTWRTLPDVPDELVYAHPLAWTGEEMLAATSGLDPWRLHAYNPLTGTARALAERPGQRDGRAVWTGAELLMINPHNDDRAGGATTADAYDPARDRWTRLPDVRLDANRDASFVWTGRELLVWGGAQYAQGGDDAFRDRNAGARYRPGQAAPPHVADYALDVAVEVLGDAPFSATVAPPPPLALPGTVDHAVALVTSNADIVLTSPGFAGRMLTGEGILLSVGEECGWHRDELRDADGLLTSCGYAGVTRLRPGRAAEELLTVVAQEPPFAPVEGTYSFDAPISWWRYREPGNPYPEQADGEASIRVTYTVTGLSDAGRDPRVGQAEQRAALARPLCEQHEHVIGSGKPAVDDGTLQVRTDGLGWFGSGSWSARMVDVNPAGPRPPARRVSENVLFVNGMPLRECNPQDADPAQVVEATPSRMETTWATDGLDLRLVQEARDLEITQVLTVTNSSGTARSVQLVRYLQHTVAEEPDEGFHAGASRAGTELYAFEEFTDPALPSYAVRVGGALDGRPADVWAVGDGFNYSRRIESDQQIPADDRGRVAHDADGDRISDEPYDAALVQQWTETIAPGASVTLTVDVAFVEAVPNDAAASA